MKLGAHGKWETKMRGRDEGKEGTEAELKSKRGESQGAGDGGRRRGEGGKSSLTGLDMPRRRAKPRPRLESLFF